MDEIQRIKNIEGIPVSYAAIETTFMSDLSAPCEWQF
jgi:hypothetical protein